MEKIVKFSIGVGVLLLGLILTSTPIFATGYQEILVATNDSAENTIQIYDSNLNLLYTRTTGGTGIGVSLGALGGIAVSGDILTVVNPGSNTLSSFKINDTGVMDIVSTVDVRGIRPVSAAMRGNLVYVANQGDNTISGFTYDANGKLIYLENSTRTLIGSKPTKITFDPMGKELIIANPNTNQIEILPLDSVTHLPGPSVLTRSTGDTPISMDVRGNKLIVSETLPFQGSGVSTYQIQLDGTLTRISSVSSEQRSGFDVKINKAGTYAYVSNTDSNSISSYARGTNGQITLAKQQAGFTNSGPKDLSLLDSTGTLYVLTDEAIQSFKMALDGSLIENTDRAAITRDSYGLLTIQK